MSDLLSQLNDAQRQAAATVDGPVMIIAGAGSGKTRTLTFRIAHLIEMGVDPFNVLALTFTNKAAAEMKERIIGLVGSDARNIWMGTFHSVFARILRSEAPLLGYTNSFTIYDTDDSQSVIKQIVKQLNLDPKVYSPRNVLGRISMAKSNLLSPDDYANNAEIQQADAVAKKTEIGNIYGRYNRHLRNSNAMDFDDLLFNMNVLLRDCPDVLLKYQQRFRYILVDEYQDTNYAQYLIIKKLAARYQNICVVGDDAQSIYAFRGANIQNIFNFKRDYPNLQLFKLEQNYRSTQVIVNAANSVIANNSEQIPKVIWTDNPVGNKIRLLSCVDERDEGLKVADAIRNARLDDDTDYKDYAILYRTNSQSRSIEDALRRAAIPYRIYQGISFYGRREVKDALAYMRLVVNNHDDESLLRAINYPPRGIGQTSLDKIRIAAADNDVSIFTVLENMADFALGVNTGTVNRINEFVLRIKRFSAEAAASDAYTMAKQIVDFSGIIRHLQADDDPDNPDRVDNIEELLNGVKEFCDSDDDLSAVPLPDEADASSTPAFRTLDQFLQQVLLFTSEDKDKDKDANKVSLMTIHAAKGLEFPHVYVVGLEETLFPSFMSMNSRQELEEERRLFYVAVTRAERHLTLSYALSRYMNGSSSCREPSRFVDEIDPEFVEVPSRLSAFPKPGELPRQFYNIGRPGRPGPDSGRPGVTSPSGSRRTTVTNSASSAPVPNSPAEIGSIAVGMTVAHAKFGRGQVLAVEGSGDNRKAIVFFDGIGQKQLLLRFAKLSIVN